MDIGLTELFRILSSGNLVPDGNPLVVGDERPMNRLFQGLIDEVAVFNRALSQGNR